MESILKRTAIVLMFAAGIVTLFAQSNATQTASPAQQQTAAQSQDQMSQDQMQTQDAKAFNGTIMKEKGKLVLKDTVANVSYQLDDQVKAKPFVGKQVKVVGKLDLDTNLIHIQVIEAAS
jgi:uncharacterized protein YdeI (BOF family)